MAEEVVLLTVREAAKLLRISRNLAYELVARGEIPAIRLGRVIRVPRSALAHWLEAESAGEVAGKHTSQQALPLHQRGEGAEDNGGAHRASR